jgi:hypothetical protein
MKNKAIAHRQLQRWASLLLVATVLLACSAGQPTAQDTPPPQRFRVLFIGNSYTFVNNLPDMFADLARSGDHEVDVAMSAQGGWTLERHAGSEETLAKLERQEWDYVVLQEQSVLPSQPEERQVLMYPAVRLLNSEIEKHGAKAILFMTWGRRDGLAKAGFTDFSAMQAALESGYVGIADELDLMVAPVGIAWRNALEQEPQLELWDRDGSHPSVDGSYLAACVLYAAIFGQSPVGLEYVAGLPVETGRTLQTFAGTTVLGEPDRWNLRR